MNHILKIKKELTPIKQELNAHPLYTSFNSLDDIRTFSEFHVFAVWDFMSLLKSLQHHLSTVTVPWYPPKNSAIARFINEIVIGEETDLDINGIPKSHFEMYLDAMDQIQADTTEISRFVSEIKNGMYVVDAVNSLESPIAVKNFLSHTFDVISTNEPHKIASAFTFGREDVIPEMFIEIVKNIQTRSNLPCDKMIYYLNRHIELDGDEHGPLSMKMIQMLCGNDKDKWEDCIEIATKSLKLRISLWDAVITKLNEKNKFSHSKLSRVKFGKRVKI